MITLKLKSSIATEELGAWLARLVPKGCIIYLRGELGTGKTTLVRGLLRALGHKGSVPSPTYTLLEPYTLEGREIIHLDLYRLADPEELEFLGMRDWFDGDALLLVEWPERGGELLPMADVDVCLEHAGNARLCRLVAGSPAGEAVLAQLGHALSRTDIDP